MSLMLGVVFGAIGTGYLVYAKRATSPMHAVAGVLLIVFPYFVSNAWLTCLIGVVLAAAPFVLERYGS